MAEEKTNNQTAQDASQQEERGLYPLGVPGLPYPMMAPATTGKDGAGKTISMDAQLGSLQDPLWISSALDYKKVMGMAYRENPSPSMHRVWFNGLQKRQPDSKRNVQFVMGPRGGGKSHLMGLAGRMRDERGAIEIDCGNRNLEELIFETTLDMESDKTLFQKIEERAAKGELNPLSLQALKEGLGKGISTEGDKVAFDWASVNAPINEDDKDDQKNRVAKAAEALEKVAALEGLEKSGDGIGIKTRPGPLIKAWEEGREIVLDEYNRGKEGSDAGLQTIWQVMNGERAETTFHGGAGKEYTFRQSEMKPGFFVGLTGNYADDGSSVINLSHSAYDRLRPDFIGDPTAEDLAHRVCQVLTDVPVTTLHKSNAQWDKDPKGFGKFISTIQTLGRDEEEIRNIPEIQTKMIGNWQNVMKAAEKLGTFYENWAKMVDPNNDKNPPGISQEIDEEYQAQSGVGMRMLIDHLNRATSAPPKVTAADYSETIDPMTAFNEVPTVARKVGKVGEDFGTTLCAVILEDIENASKARGKTNLYEALKKEAADAGIIEIDLQDGYQSTTMESIPSLLNLVDKADNVKVTDNTLRTQNILCEHLRRLDPELSSDNNEVVPSVEVELGIQDLLKEKAELEKDQIRDRYVVLPNPEFMDSIDESTKPFVLVPVADAIYTEDEIQDPESYQQRFSSNGDLLGHETFLETVAMPTVGKANLDSLWNQVITGNPGGIGPYLPSVGECETGDDASIDMTEGKSSTGLAVTTVMCGKEGTDDASTLKVLMKQEGEKHDVLITSEEAIPEKLQIQLQEAGVEYVQIGQEGSKQQVNKALTRLLGEDDKRAEVEDHLVHAYQFRNSPTEEEQEESMEPTRITMEDAMMSQNLPTAPIHLLKHGKAKQIR